MSYLFSGWFVSYYPVSVRDKFFILIIKEEKVKGKTKKLMLITFVFSVFILAGSGCGKDSNKDLTQPSNTGGGNDNSALQFSGTWIGTSESSVGNSSGNIRIVITQQGSTLNGSIDISYGFESIGGSVKGTINGSNITFSDIENKLVFTGTISGGSLSSGSYTYSSKKDKGTWQCRKINGSFTIIDSIKSPGMMPNGLTLDGKYFWIVATGEIYKIDSSGNTIATLNSPTFTAYSLAFDGNYLWVLGGAFDKKIYKLDASTGEIITSFNAPGDNPNGLAFDGVNMWSSDSSGKIYKLDSNGNVVAFFDCPVKKGIKTFDGKYFWSSEFPDWSGNGIIYRFDISGNDITLFNSPGGRPTGLAFDGEYLWNADWTDRKIYKLKIN